MVQNIRCIVPELQVLGFGQPNVFAHRRIESPGSRQFYRFLAECAAMAGLGVLEQNLARLRVGDCLQRAVRLELGSEPAALRIGDLREPRTEVASKVTVPL